METTLTDGRRKLSDADKQAIHDRYYDRIRLGLTVQEIADDFGIVRQWVPVVAREVEEAQKEKAPDPDRSESP